MQKLHHFDAAVRPIIFLFPLAFATADKNILGLLKVSQTTALLDCLRELTVTAISLSLPLLA